MLLIEHIWAVRHQKKPIQMFGWFRDQNSFYAFATREMKKWNAVIQQGETKEYSEEYFLKSMGKI